MVDPLHRKHQYIALKVYVTGHRQALNEKKVLDHIAKVREGQVNSRFIRALLDHFEILGKKGPHHCLVHEPLVMTLKTLRSLVSLSIENLQLIVRDVLRAIHFLHTVADVVHTGISFPAILRPSS